MAATHRQEPVGLIVTGGTIGAGLTGSVVHLLDSQDDRPPELDLILADESPDLHIIQPLRRLSENMVPKDWVTIANATTELVENSGVSGIVVLHGTDTASYTAAALSFLTTDLEVPIVLTGSNLPPGEEHSDARRNVQDAMTAANHLGPGTYLSFAGTPEEPSWVHRGTNVRKIRASGQAFYSINSQPVAQVRNGEFVQYQPANVPRSGGYRREVDDRVLGIRLYPGIDLQLLADAAVRGGMRGIVIELYPSGTGPTIQGNSSLPEFVRQCDANDIVVATTVAESPDDPTNMYETSVDIVEAGALFIDDMIPETVLVKLMWALAQSQSTDQVKKLMLRPIVEERYDPTR